MAQIQRTIISEPYRHNAVLYFQDTYGTFFDNIKPDFDNITPDVSYIDFYNWLEKEWGCKFIVDYKDKERKEYLIFEDEKRASLFILRW